MLCLEENKRIVLVGIPGVGKTTLLARIVKILEEKQKDVCTISYGTLMLEVARKNGLRDRDELRKLPISKQQELQRKAAEEIAAHTQDIVIIDTHAFINSEEGYYSGLPEHVLRIINPTNFVSVSANPEEIYSRRMKDDSRVRDKITLPNIKKELDVQSGMVSAYAVITGSPVKYILNREGKADDAADKIIGAIGL